MAPATLTVARSKVAAVAAMAVLVVLALHGRWPSRGTVGTGPDGLLEMPPAAVREVRLVALDRTWRFARSGEQWTPAPAPSVRDVGPHVESGLRLLHGAAAQRTMTRDEYSGVAARDFGLDPPRYTVIVDGKEGRRFTLHVGGLTAQGAALYAQVAGREELFLLPRSIGEPWELLLAAE